MCCLSQATGPWPTPGPTTRSGTAAARPRPASRCRSPRIWLRAIRLRAESGTAKRLAGRLWNSRRLPVVPSCNAYPLARSASSPARLFDNGWTVLPRLVEELAGERPRCWIPESGGRSVPARDTMRRGRREVRPRRGGALDVVVERGDFAAETADVTAAASGTIRSFCGG
jgi:hypothetical protein